MNDKQLTTDERFHMDELLRDGHLQRLIAKRRGSSPSSSAPSHRHTLRAGKGDQAVVHIKDKW